MKVDFSINTSSVLAEIKNTLPAEYNFETKLSQYILIQTAACKFSESTRGFAKMKVAMLFNPISQHTTNKWYQEGILNQIKEENK